MQNEMIYKKLIEIESLLKLGSDEIFDIEGAAKFLKTSKSTIYQYVFRRSSLLQTKQKTLLLKVKLDGMVTGT